MQIWRIHISALVFFLLINMILKLDIIGRQSKRTRSIRFIISQAMSTLHLSIFILCCPNCSASSITQHIFRLYNFYQIVLNLILAHYYVTPWYCLCIFTWFCCIIKYFCFIILFLNSFFMLLLLRLLLLTAYFLLFLLHDFVLLVKSLLGSNTFLNISIFDFQGLKYDVLII